MRRFNVTGLCVPKKHYMVNIQSKLDQIRKLIDKGSYFTMNRARQFGKTTTLAKLEGVLQAEYIVISLTFEDLGDESFKDEATFCYQIMELVQDALVFTSASPNYIESWLNPKITNFKKLSRHITRMAKGHKLVLMIDEVDKISNNRIFLNFLSVLRSKYLASIRGRDFTFHSVILAGVYDVKNIKLKLMNVGLHQPKSLENQIYNSPWNIAINFEVDMSFNSEEISTMLLDYEADNQTGMDISLISQEIYRFTHGYPFLVSKVCQCIDEKLNKDWTMIGIKNAIEIIIKEENTLFQDLAKNLEGNNELYELVYDILIVGHLRSFSVINPTIELAIRYGYLKNINNEMMVSNKIFEMVICDYFISKDEARNRYMSHVVQQDILVNGRFNMELCLKKFASHYQEIFNKNDIEFLERHGRLLFLCYLKPLLNGRGFYHIESQFTDLRRMDLVVDFKEEQFIIELKLWKGEKVQERAYEQLLGYMKSKDAKQGYLLTFDFRNERNREQGARWLSVDNREVFEIII